MKILIKNGTIVNANGGLVSDVLCSDGKIVEIGKNIVVEPSSTTVIDATGCFVIPGGIDPHVHMNLPCNAGFSSDDFNTGSIAALYGGTTSIIDFVTPQRNQSLEVALENRKLEANNCNTDYSFHLSPVDWHKGIIDEIEKCIDNGFLSFKVYMAYKNSIGLDYDVLLKVMKVIANAGGLLLIHCELGDDIDSLQDKLAEENKLEAKYHPLSRPPYAEAEAVRKSISMAAETGCSIYIVHVSTKESVQYIKQAQQRGQVVYAETCPQYLLLDVSLYDNIFEESVKYVMSPPLRKKDDIDALWEALSDGTIQTIGTDHCPTMLSQKKFGKNDFRKIPNGAGGVEHRLLLMYTYGVLEKKISLSQFVALTSTNAAQIFGLEKKGIVKEGADADLVVWNPEKENIINASCHHQNCDINIYEGMKVMGFPDYVIRNGNVVIENDKLIDKKYGHLIDRQ